MVYRPSDLASDPAILDLGGPNLGSPEGRTKALGDLAADVEGYSRLMGGVEVGTLRALTAYRVIIDRLIASHRGRIFNTAGDSVLADFGSAVDAVAVRRRNSAGRRKGER